MTLNICFGRTIRRQITERNARKGHLRFTIAKNQHLYMHCRAGKVLELVAANNRYNAITVNINPIAPKEAT